MMAQRSVLRARSTYFAALLGQSFAEGERGTITLPEVDHEVLSRVVAFLYSGQLQWSPELEANGYALFQALLFTARLWLLDPLAEALELALLRALTGTTEGQGRGQGLVLPADLVPQLLALCDNLDDALGHGGQSARGQEAQKGQVDPRRRRGPEPDRSDRPGSASVRVRDI